MRWLTPLCSIAALPSLPSLPSLSFSLPLFLSSLIRPVDYEDTSSSLTVWPLLHVLMRSGYLPCIINKSEKWLFLPFSHMFLYLSLLAPVISELLKNGKWGAAGFPVCSSPPLFSLHVHHHQPPKLLFNVTWKGRNYFLSIMIFSPCYDIIWFNLNLSVIDMKDLLNQCAFGRQNKNLCKWNKVAFLPFL